MQLRCAKAAIGSDEPKRLDPPGRPPIAVYRADNLYYATDDTCSHGAASLSEGFIEGFEIVCPFHSGSFDVRTGEAVAYPACEPIRSYPVTEDGDVLVIELD
jgi:nitrite reductase/ring-hydroxylating ferredoxin subunit